MSAIRAINAEEEAATALILALKHRRYPGAERLSQRRHDHKAAFTALFSALRPVAFREGDIVEEYILRLDKDSVPPRFELLLDASKITGKKGFFQPDHPLNFTISRTGVDELHDAPSIWNLPVHDFEDELHSFASKAGQQKFDKHINAEANIRNKIFYASDDGIPGISIEKGFLEQRLKRVFTLVVIAMIILQTPTLQLFAAQCIESILKALELNKSAKQFDWNTAKPTSTRKFTVIAREGEKPKLWLSRRFSTTTNSSCHFLPMYRIGDWRTG